MTRLVITMGDPCGVGPEILLKFFEIIYKIENKNTKKILRIYTSRTNNSNNYIINSSYNCIC